MSERNGRVYFEERTVLERTGCDRAKAAQVSGLKPHFSVLDEIKYSRRRETLL